MTADLEPSAAQDEGGVSETGGEESWLMEQARLIAQEEGFASPPRG
jgi:hypothetical protein